ncbi:CRAL/TRIO domain-containing protein [Arthroderma uncinatum]|uniref:CRAL/TRIO domain-containing protein n=1 Tax=Arthroderma uncinatum TaxID=74035 RepID=UPI00144AB3DB|nr:CRAL/TRIO domain-containing protein [Arthroderma uncinatum]KAF3479689.1 CRAL/TRIO domain-containing protein [Arthroderma uncinatum]
MSLDETPTNQAKPPQLNKLETNQSTASASASDPLSGHLNHLSEVQTEALDAFKKECEARKIYTPAEDGGEASHDDSTLLRFLRARRFDVNGALAQFQSTEEWRKENDIDALYENFDVDSYEQARRVYPQWTGRRDRRGIPIYVYVIKHLNNKNMTAYTSSAANTATSSTHASSKVPPRLLRLFALYENMVRFVLPLCTRLDRPNPESPIVNTTNIVDITGVGLKQFWNLKGHMQDASTLATAHYPETLDRIFVSHMQFLPRKLMECITDRAKLPWQKKIIGAPVFFPTVWGWIKRWFDPGTTSKIFILSAADVQPTLSSFMDPADIPKRYGGELDWDWGDMPNLDEPARALVGSCEIVGPYADKPDEKENSSGEATEGAEARKSNFIKGPATVHNDRIEVLGSIKGEERRKTFPLHVSQSEKQDAEVIEEAKSESPDPTVQLSNDLEKAALSQCENVAPVAANAVASA